MSNAARSLMIGVSLAALVAGAAGVAYAEPAPAETQTISEVVVTATKSAAQTVFKTPMPIQAFSGERLKEQNINNLTDLISAIPGASEGQNTAQVVHSYNLRGVGAGVANGDSPTSYYLDDVPFVVPNFGIAPPVQFLDLERVEVLRGPQGTLYGQGAAGGTIIFHTRDPDLHEIRGSAEVVGSQTKLASGLNYAYSGAVSIPLVQDKLALRLSGGYTKNQGYEDAFTGPPVGAPFAKDVNDTKNTDFRAVLLWKPSDKVRVRAQYWQFAPFQDYASYAQVIDPPQVIFTGGNRGYTKGVFNLYSLSASADVSGVTVTSSTSYLDAPFGAFFVLPGATLFSTFHSKALTEEFRLNSNGSGHLHWVIGAQYQNAKGPNRNILDIPLVFSADTSTNTKSKNWATFGEVSYDLFGGKLVPLVGLRYYHDDRTFSTASSASTGAISATTPSNKTTWRLNLSYYPTDNITTFATISTGFRAGISQSAVQAQLLQGAGFPATIQNRPDALTNYEAGLKWRTFGGALNVGANIYHIKMKDMQVGVTGLAGVGGYINAGDGHTTGLDLELQWRTPIEGLSLGAMANINDSKFDSVIPAVQAQVPTFTPGGRLVSTTKYNYRFDANYIGELTSSVSWFANASFARFSNRLTPYPGLLVSAYDSINATLGVRSGPWELSLFGQNLGNDLGPTSIAAPGLETPQTPRTVGLRLRVDYR